MAAAPMDARFGGDVFGSSFPDIKADSVVLDIAMHPLQDVCAVGTITGSVEMWAYGNAPAKAASRQLFSQSCRSLTFSEDGNRLFCASKTGAVVSLDASGKEVGRIAKAHDSAITRAYHFAAVMLATGDEDGSMAVWDMRTSKPIMSFPAMTKKKHFEEGVSSFLYVGGGASPTLLATSTDGSLGVVDLRTATVAHRSEQIQDELLSLALMKGGRKVVAGTLEQGLAFFTWGRWTEPDDRFSSLPDSIERLCPISPDVLAAGCGDGTVRLLQVQPHAEIQTLAELGDNAVEAMEPSRDGRVLAVSAQEPTVTFVDLAAVSATAPEESATSGGTSEEAPSSSSSASSSSSSSSSSSLPSSAGGRSRLVGRARGPGMGGSDFFSDL